MESSNEVESLREERDELLAELSLLREREALHRHVLDTMASGLVLLDAEGRVVRCNASAERILRTDASDLSGKPFLDKRWRLLREDGSACPVHEQPAAVTLRSGADVRTVVGLQQADGDCIWIAINTAAVRRGGRVETVIVSFTDITERRRITEALREREAHVHLALEAARMGVWDWRVGGVVRWSPETEVLFGLEPGTFDGTFETFMSFIHPEDREATEAAIARAFAPGGERDFEIEHRIVRADGEVVWFAARARVIRDAKGVPIALRGIVLDNTAHKQLEEQLLQSHKLELVGRLAGGIAHDFNNLLTAIGGALELARRRWGRAEHRDAIRHLDDAADAVSRAAHLTRQLLTFAKKNPVRVVPMRPGPVLERTIGMLRHLLEETLAIEVRIAPDLGAVRADPVLLEQVLVNLAINAGDAMDPGGKLTISARNATIEHDPELDDGGYLELVVADTGSGISADDLAQIFEPFFTTKHDGTGLGLSTVQGIVRQLGGRVRVESALGTGTTFTILLPRCSEPPVEERRRSAVPRAQGQATVLAVEDNPMVRRVLEEVLAGHGYEVLVASNAADALELSDGHAGTIHALVSDVVMPGMTGPNLARELQRRRPGIKVLLTSGYAGEALNLPAMGPDTAFIQKPYRHDELIAKLEALLD